MADTKTEVVITESVVFGKEHIAYIDNVIRRIQETSKYKVTRSQFVRVLVESAMTRTLNFGKIHNEEELKQELMGLNDPDKTHVIKTGAKKA